jgi:hypothetical protein
MGYLVGRGGRRGWKHVVTDTSAEAGALAKEGHQECQPPNTLDPTLRTAQAAPPDITYRAMPNKIMGTMRGSLVSEAWLGMWGKGERVGGQQDGHESKRHLGDAARASDASAPPSRPHHHRQPVRKLCLQMPTHRQSAQPAHKGHQQDRGVHVQNHGFSSLGRTWASQTTETSAGRCDRVAQGVSAQPSRAHKTPSQRH